MVIKSANTFSHSEKKLNGDLCVALGVDKVCPVEGGWVEINRGEVLRRLHQLCPAPDSPRSLLARPEPKARLLASAS